MSSFWDRHQAGVEHFPVAVYDYWLSYRSLSRQVSPHTTQLSSGRFVLRQISFEEGARFVSVFAALCNDGGCLTHTPASRSELLIFDDGHFTTAGAKFVADLVGLKN